MFAGPSLFVSGLRRGGGGDGDIDNLLLIVFSWEKVHNGHPMMFGLLPVTYGGRC